METDTDVLNMMAKFIVNASVKAEIIELLHHQSDVYASCRKFQGSNSTVSTFTFGNTLYHWMHLSTIDIGDISNQDKRPLSSQTSLVYLPLRAAAMLEDARTRVYASSVAPMNMQDITQNSKRWDYPDIPGGGHKKIKGPTHMAEGGHHLRKAPNSLPLIE